jgi:hypothetical protein
MAERLAELQDQVAELTHEAEEVHLLVSKMVELMIESGRLPPTTQIKRRLKEPAAAKRH